MSETENIGKMAELVSEELLKFYRWGVSDLFNENFECKKPQDHSKKEKYTHPVDVVFNYLDPYTGKRVLFNTDLKSYIEGSIDRNKVRTALVSLAKTIACARISKQWTNRYADFKEAKEIRALLFVYNHDGKFDRDFYSRFFIKLPTDKANKQIINTSTLGLQKDQYLHILEPVQINYLNTVVQDINSLAANRKFPSLWENKYWFFYPELCLHKTHFNKYERPAAIELLTSQLMIIGHDEIKEGEKLILNKGYVVYYNGRGDSIEEFVYLLDTISKYQILDSAENIRIRCTSPDKNVDIIAIFKNAINHYASAWGFDKFKEDRLRLIEDNFELVTQSKELLSEINIGWRV